MAESRLRRAELEQKIKTYEAEAAGIQARYSLPCHILRKQRTADDGEGGCFRFVACDVKGTLKCWEPLLEKLV